MNRCENGRTKETREKAKRIERMQGRLETVQTVMNANQYQMAQTVKLGNRHQTVQTVMCAK